MTMNVYGNGVNSSAGANTVIHYYDRAGTKAANRTNVYGQFADRKSMPKKMGKTFKISKFLHMYDRALGDADFAAKGFMTNRTAQEVSDSLTAAGLAEGAGAVNQRSIEKVTVETSIARYGEMLQYTDEVDLFSEDHIQVRYREELGELANSRYEDLIQLDLLSTGTVLYSGSATSNATVGATQADGSDDDDYKATYELVRKMSRKLVRNRAKKTTSLVTGSTKIDTRTVAQAFYAIIGADVKADLEVSLDSVGKLAWVPVHKYGAAASVAEGEVGAVHEMRFIEAESAIVYAGAGAAVPTGYVGSLANTTFATDAAAIAVRGAGATAGTYFDVYPILVPSQGAFATVGLKGQGKITFKSKSPEQVENANPYGTNGFFSYNFFYAGILLEEEKVLRAMVCASK